ncbi:hypothetical protein ABW21_db0202332 [Orbilia brochopaga]|nr:hypothetical protein ABW21_db0202332 [Drechslerella brochopaga]
MTPLERALLRKAKNRTAGAISVEKIISCAEKDRIASKEVIDNLEINLGAPSTSRVHSLWWNRFKAFYTETLQKEYVIPHIHASKLCELTGTLSIAQTPDEEDVQRFWVSLPEKMKARGREDLVSINSIVNGNISLSQVLTFRYKNWKPSRNLDLKLRSILNDMLERGQITSAAARERAWVSLPVVATMLTSFLTSAYQDGCRSWDVTVSRLVSVCLLAASQARAGDILRSRDYTGNEFLCWGDIQLAFVGDKPDVCNLVVIN